METGKVVLDGEVYAWGMDGRFDTSGAVPFQVIDALGEPISEPLLRPAWLGPSSAIEGSGALELGGERMSMFLDLRALSPELAGRRIEITYWQRPQGTWLTGSLFWALGDVDLFWSDGYAGALSPAGNVAFQRTGRVTDDGWEEWSSGPVDFELGGSHPPSWLYLEDAQIRPYQLGGSETRFIWTSRVHLDALEIRDLGPAVAEGARCRARTEAEVCGASAVCYLGRCTDAAQIEGQIILDAGRRRDFLQNLVFAYRTFEGSREGARLLPQLHFGASLLGRETEAAPFWRTLRQSVEGLHSGHAFAPAQRRGLPFIGTGACLLLGEADLRPGAEHLPLVYEADPDHPLGRRLLAGDVLVSIDDLPVSVWSELASFDLAYPGDPAGREVVEAGQLLVAAFGLGSRLRFERCPRLAANGACAEPLQTVTVDLGEIAEQALWGTRLPEWFEAEPGCDYRVERTAPLEDRTAWSAAASNTVDGVRYLTFNGMPPTERYGGSGRMERAFVDALADAPARAILDSRLGYGGYEDMISYTASFLLSPGSGVVQLDYPGLSLPLDEALREDLASCTARLDGSHCGGAMRFSPDDRPEPFLGAAADTRVALLLTDDASANDYFPRLVRSRQGPTRFFGPAPTWGAFGWILYLPEVQPGAIFGSLQVTDAVFLDRDHADPLDFRTGRGVVPDELVLQKQSDLLRGVDTVMEAARAWLGP